MDIESRRKRIFVRAEEAHEAKSCKTCDFCVKPDMYDISRWQCKAPENAIVDAYNKPRISPVSGDVVYYHNLCIEVKSFKFQGIDCAWYQLDPYIPINGKRQVDIYREERKLSTPSERISLKNLTLKDIL